MNAKVSRTFFEKTNNTIFIFSENLLIPIFLEHKKKKKGTKRVFHVLFIFLIFLESKTIFKNYNETKHNIFFSMFFFLKNNPFWTNFFLPFNVFTLFIKRISFFLQEDKYIFLLTVYIYLRNYFFFYRYLLY